MTLIEKSCGHFGYLRSNYTHEHVSCSQCAYADPSLERVMVPIRSRLAFDDLDIPDFEGERLNEWIRRRMQIGPRQTR